IFQIIAFADKAVLGLVGPYAMADLGLNATQFGFIGSAFFFLYAIVSVVTGILASKISVHWILFTLGVVWAVVQFPMRLGGGTAGYSHQPGRCGRASHCDVVDLGAYLVPPVASRASVQPCCHRFHNGTRIRCSFYCVGHRNVGLALGLRCVGNHRLGLDCRLVGIRRRWTISSWQRG